MAFYTLENEAFCRVFEVSDSGVRSVSMKDKRSGLEYLQTPVREFQFSVDDRMFSSWMSKCVRIVDGNTESYEAAPEFLCAESGDASLKLCFAVGTVEITIEYRIFAGICGYRKHLSVKNTSSAAVRLNKLVFDDTCAAPGKLADCDFYSGFGDTPQPLCFTCEGNEDMIRCHDETLNAGWFMGSSAPGVLRYMMIYPVWRNALNALNMSSAPFAVILQPGETFCSPDSIFALYSGGINDETSVRDFKALLRQNLPPLTSDEGIMYCTWIPFLKNINAKLISELVRNAAELDYRYFVLDDGWFTMDDHAVDKAKFPGGLEEVSRMVRDAGMVFGLWLNIGTDYGRKNLPENYFARQYDGRNSRLGFDYSKSGNVLCLGSAYREAVVEELSALADKYAPGYFKLDFSSIASPYGLLPYGCHATDHEHHHCWEDSFYAIYEGMNYIRDTMAARYPHIIVDFSFETFGTEKPNIAALELSALHHVTNIAADDLSVQSISKARKSFYPWLKRLPAERILNGLLAVQGASYAEAMLTSFAGAPLTAGDLRLLSREQKERLKCFTSGFNKSAADGVLSSFTSFEYGKEVDGFCRVNEKGSGFAAFFNRSGNDFTFAPPANVTLTNVENGATLPVVPANDCAMFFWQKND